MDVLSKILQEIEEEAMRKPEIGRKQAEGMARAMDIIRKHLPDNDGWILVEEEMPKERKSIFAKLKNTERWSTSMFEKKSDDVNVTVEYEDGTRGTVTMHTLDGEWKYPRRIIKQKAIAWQPLPEPYRAEERIETNGEES